MELLQKIDFRPASLHVLKNYSLSKLKTDLIAGIVVGIVALPLAIAFAIASGVSPTAGLVTAIIGGFIVSAFGGNSVQIGGPTGAFIVIVYNIIALYGLTGLAIATFMAGCLLLLMGVFKLGTVIKFIPYPIVVGFTAGIALTIFSTQMKDFFGLSIDGAVPSDFIGKWGVYFSSFHTIDWTTTLVGVLSLLLIVAVPRISRRLPGALVAIIVMSAAVWILRQFGIGGEIETIGDRFTGMSSSMPAPHSLGINMESINLLLPSAFTIAMLGAIESLLSATVGHGGRRCDRVSHQFKHRTYRTGAGQYNSAFLRRYTRHRRHSAYHDKHHQRRPHTGSRNRARPGTAAHIPVSNAADQPGTHGLSGSGADNRILQHERLAHRERHIPPPQERYIDTHRHIPADCDIRPDYRHRDGTAAGHIALPATCDAEHYGACVRQAA